jgi:hypothetical protein
MKTSDKVLWVVWLSLIGLMLFTHDKQRMEIQRLNGVVYELRMERSGWISDLNVMEAKVASVEIGEEE